MHRLNYEKNDLGFGFGLAVAVMVVASLALQLIFGSEPTGWQFWLMQAVYTSLIGASAAVYAPITKTKFFAATKFNKKPPLAHMGWGILMTACLIFAMMPINIHLMDAIEAIGLKRPQTGIEHQLTGDLGTDLPGLIIVACFLPAFCEELVFRGTVAQSVSSMKNRFGALAVCGALFAIFHANPAQTIHQFVLGALLALLVLRSGSVWTSIAVHLFNNAFVVASIYTPLGQDDFWRLNLNTEVALPLMLAGLVGFGLSVFGYLKTTQSAWQSVEAAPQKEQSPLAREGSIAALAVSSTVCLALWISVLFVG